MLNRRNEQTMMDLILQVAKLDPRIRGVLLNGSRASPSAPKDIFQDYDIVYIVKDVASFVEDPHWINQFGEILILQKPDEMDEIWPEKTDSFAYLAQFKDWNRIDLTLVRQDKFAERRLDSQTQVLLDKDNLLGNIPPASDKDYIPTPPTQLQFNHCCNEFLWVSTYVAKGLWRQELIYAKEMAEHNVKASLIKMLTWYAGIKTHFAINTGKYGKYLEKYIEPELWNKFVKTYVDASFPHMWEGLFQMCDLFQQVAIKVAQRFGFVYDEKEHQAVTAYLKAVCKYEQPSSSIG